MLGCGEPSVLHFRASGVGLVDYICYLSRSKVDGLYDQIHPERHEDITEQEQVERANSVDVQGGLSLGQIVNLFRGGITYGRRNVIQRERKVRVTYVEKLREILLNIAVDHGDIPNLQDALVSGARDSLYYFHTGVFSCATPVEESTAREDLVVTLRSPVGGRTLLLDCSLRFFSESADRDGAFLIHSGNSRFFAGRLTLRMSGVIVLLGVTETEILGTPLFLQLSSTAAVL
jgi:hypothetical protein